MHRPQLTVMAINKQELTLIRQHFHQQRVLLPAVNDVSGGHSLRQTPCAALHPVTGNRSVLR